MNQNTVKSFKENLLTSNEDIYFFTETIEVEQLSPFTFLQVGEKQFMKDHFYWQNADASFTIVGLGKERVLRSNETDNRFTHISQQWEKLCKHIKKRTNDLAPIIFGGFSFDPSNKKQSEWSQFPSAYFILPSIQFVKKNKKSFVMINAVANKSSYEKRIAQLREIRNDLIHAAKKHRLNILGKPIVTSLQEIAKDEYLAAVKGTTEQIKAREAEKVVIARSIKLTLQERISSVEAIYHIANEQVESYHFGLQKDGELFFGATPERLIEVNKGHVYSACVAGSIKRGATEEEDREVGEELLNDPKNREEHQYVVDMISNVFQRLCTEINIPREPILMKIRDIQHLFTPVDAVMNDGVSILQFIEALHPTPALGGVPTKKAMGIIKKEEQLDRGYYAGPIGWLDTEGNGEFAVAIRSALLKDEEAFLYAGGGIVGDSEVESEYDETWIKFRPVLRALGGQVDDK